MLRLGFIVAPGFQVMGFGALFVFEFANFSVVGPFHKCRSRNIWRELAGRETSSTAGLVEPRGSPDAALNLRSRVALDCPPALQGWYVNRCSECSRDPAPPHRSARDQGGLRSRQQGPAL